MNNENGYLANSNNVVGSLSDVLAKFEFNLKQRQKARLMFKNNYALSNFEKLTFL